MGRLDTRGLRFERTGSDDELMQDALVVGLEAAALCGSESLIREFKRREGVQGLTHPRELLREPDGQRAKRRRRVCLLAHDGNGVFENPPSLIVVFRDFECRDQGQGFLALEPVPLNGFRQGILIRSLQRTESLCERDPDPAMVDEALELG